MFFVCMFNLGSVDDGVSGSEEGEEEGEDDCGSEVCSEGDPDCVDLELLDRMCQCSWSLQISIISLNLPQHRVKGAEKGGSPTADLNGF